MERSDGMKQGDETVRNLLVAAAELRYMAAHTPEHRTEFERLAETLEVLAEGNWNPDRLSDSEASTESADRIAEYSHSSVVLLASKPKQI
jgi:hypothetical protein